MHRNTIRAAFQRWLFRVGGPEPAPIQLGQRRIFVLPTAFGLTLGLTLLVMLLASINYTLSLGFGLCFLVGGVAWVSIHHAFRNLVGLSIKPGRCEPVFQGQTAHFGIIIHNAAPRPRLGLHLRPAGTPANAADEGFDIPATGSLVQPVAVPALARGWLVLPRLCLETRYPIGLIRGWSLFQPDMRCLVFPAPEAAPPPLPRGDGEQPGTGGQGYGQDDFAGLRTHQPADSPRHVAWKALARSGTWLTKQFDGSGAQVVHLDWHQLPAALDTEARLSRLARWICDADGAGFDYGLHLPGREIHPASGPAHRLTCLTALALFGEANG